ncbi:hypothetical protein B0H10DRAFT_2097382 [Mycena sp. CBHHK59/15]|nr:hypothetical protein B0H10DRAFT_2097382 [Mycena sp. CBHHK59/15]
MLVEAFSACGLGVSIATDGTLYQTEVFTASHSPAFTPSSPSVTSVSSHGHSSSSHGSGSKKGKESKKWGDRPVLYETIKVRVFVSLIFPSFSSRTLPSRPFFSTTFLLAVSFPFLSPSLALEYQSLTRSPAPLYLPSVCRHRGRASFIIALLRRRTGRRPVLSFDPHHSRPAVPLRPFAAEPAP